MRFCLFIILIVLSTSAMGQTAIFKVFIGDKIVGKMTVAKTFYFNSRHSIDLQADFQTESVGVSTIVLYSSSYFKNNYLTDAESILERNGKVREKCVTHLTKITYTIERKNENPINLTATIQLTMTMLFLMEPKGWTQVFSERHGEFCTVKPVSTGIYEVSLPLGGLIRYYYQNGLCIKAETVGNVQNIIYKSVKIN